VKNGKDMDRDLDQIKKFLVPEFLFGVKSRFKAKQYLNNLNGKHVLIVSDPGVIEAGWVNDISKQIDSINVEYSIFSEISPNPRDFQIHEGAKLYKKEKCDIILAIGGGSVLDAAKGIGIIATNGGIIQDYEGIDKILHPIPPIICVPTTSGSSADISQFAIINDVNKRKKIAIISKAMVPDFSLIDPETLITKDPYLIACTGLDALSHAFEALVSNSSSYMTNIHSLEAIKLVNKHLINQYNNPKDINAAWGMMQASLQAGMAFSNASLGCIHALAHSVGSYLDLAHGDCNAILLNSVIDFNYSSADNEYKKAAEVLNIPTTGLSDVTIKKELIKYITKLKLELGLNHSFSEKGLKKCDIKHLANNAINDPCLVTNPRNANIRDIEVLYEEAI